MFGHINVSPKSSDCNNFGLPYVYQFDGTVPAGTDTAAATINPFLLSSNELLESLQNISVATDGCEDLIARVEYAAVGDCDVCTNPDEVTLGYRYYYLDRCEARSFMNGLVVDIDFVAVPRDQRTGDPEADWALAGVTQQDMRLRFYGDSAKNACCKLPEITNTRGVTQNEMGDSACPPGALLSFDVSGVTKDNITKINFNDPTNSNAFADTSNSPWTVADLLNALNSDPNGGTWSAAGDIVYLSAGDPSLYTSLDFVSIDEHVFAVNCSQARQEQKKG